MCDYIIMVEKVYHPKCLKMNYLKDSYSNKKDEEDDDEEIEDQMGRIESPKKNMRSPRGEELLLKANRMGPNIIKEEDVGESQSSMDIEEGKGSLPRGNLEHDSISKGKQRQIPCMLKKVAQNLKINVQAAQEKFIFKARYDLGSPQLLLSDRGGITQLNTSVKQDSIRIDLHTESAQDQENVNFFATQKTNALIDEQIRNGDFIDQIEAEEQDHSGFKQLRVKYEHTKLKNKHIETGTAAQVQQKHRHTEVNGAHGNRGTGLKQEENKEHFIFRRMQGLHNNQMKQMIQQTEDNETHKYQILGKSRKMGQFKKDPNELTTNYTISLWRMHQGKLPLMIASLDLTSNEEFTIYNDQVFYSHDGEYLFFLLLNNDGYLDKCVVAHSDYLTLPEQHEISLLSHRIHGSELEGEPCLLWGHKDSFDIDYINRQTSKKHPADVTMSNNYILYITHNNIASFFKESDLVLRFALHQRILNDEEEHTHDFRILSILFEQEGTNNQDILSFQSHGSSGSVERKLNTVQTQYFHCELFTCLLLENPQQIEVPAPHDLRDNAYQG